MESKMRVYQEKVLKALSGKIDDFYLAGGTALSLYYFNHRESIDLDFFTPNFSKIRIQGIIKTLSSDLKKETKIVSEQSDKNKVKVIVAVMSINKNAALKIDFVEDYLGLIKQPKLVNGVRVLSLEDIYIRKIYCVAGTISAQDITGRSIVKGNRQEAKDFYDLYCLSSIFMNLSKFCFKYCNQLNWEAIIRWFRTYSRFDMKTGLLELKLGKKIDYRLLESHFKEEIDKIIEKEIGPL